MQESDPGLWRTELRAVLCRSQDLFTAQQSGAGEEGFITERKYQILFTVFFCLSSVSLALFYGHFVIVELVTTNEITNIYIFLLVGFIMGRILILNT